MNSEFQKRLYEMEVSPPKQVWEKLSIDLDEINADNLIAGRLQNTAVLPVTAIWENIKDSFEIEEKPVFEKKAAIINWKRFAVASVFIGMFISVWLIFFNPQQGNNEIVTANTSSPSIQENKIVPENTKQTKNTDLAKNNSQAEPPLLATNKKVVENNRDNKNNLPTKRNAISVHETDVNSISLRNEKPGDKVFNQPIDDLSMIASNDNYMTMVTTNGRIVRIPSHLAHLAPHLQGKPITEDYYELMFGEGAFWKEKMSDWRQMLATSPVSSGDLFSNMVELIKSVDARQDVPGGKGK